MLANHNQTLGRTGEDAACAYLSTLGLRIIRRNFRSPDGEIDIVAQDGETIVFVEVKTRDTRSFGSALSAVDARKRRRLRAVAADFLQFFAPKAKARFDVLTLDGGRMTLHRNAFR
jgi:putative endonuclease